MPHIRYKFPVKAGVVIEGQKSISIRVISHSDNSVTCSAEWNQLHLLNVAVPDISHQFFSMGCAIAV